MSRPITVVEYTDPGCVWSWGSEPQLRWLRLHYGEQIAWRRVFGVQVDDVARSFPDRDPVADADRFRNDWLAVAEHTGAPVVERLHWFHRSTRPAAHVARAADAQGEAVAAAVLRRLREAVFVAGRPADSPDRTAAALAGIAGLDVDRLLADARSPEVAASVQADFQETRRPHRLVIGRTGPGPNPGAAKQDGGDLRYGFPTLIIDGPGGEQVVSGWNDAAALEGFVLAAGAQPADTTTSLDPDDALARFGSLTQRELSLLADDREPSAAVRIDTATSSIWVNPATADALTATSAREVAAG